MMAENRELPARSGTNAWNQRFGTVDIVIMEKL